MSPEIHFALKRLAATLASEWLEARMFPTMGYQIGRLAKRFTTVGAFVGLLSCVYVGVFFHVRLLVEALATVRTGVGPCVAVYQ